MKTVLITGGLGSLGDEIFNQLQSNSKLNILRTTSQKSKCSDIDRIFYWDMEDIQSTKELHNKLKGLSLLPDTLFHCAHKFSPALAAFSVKSDDFNTSLSTNVTATFELIKKFSKSMTRAKHGRIILLGSLVAQRGGPGKINYIVEKKAYEGLAIAFTSELKSNDVLVQILHPGLIDSPKIRERISEDVFKHLGKQELLKNEDVAEDCIKIVQGQEKQVIFELGQEQQW